MLSQADIEKLYKNLAEGRKWDFERIGIVYSLNI